jgi:hypothetical protein
MKAHTRSGASACRRCGRRTGTGRRCGTGCCPSAAAGAQQLRGVALPGVLVAVKAHQAAQQKDGQANVGIDAEEEGCQARRSCRDSFWCRWTWADNEMDGLRLVRLGLALGAAAVERPAARPRLRRALLRARGPRPALLAGQFEQRADHAGVGAGALLQRAEERVEDVRHLAQEGAGHRGRLGGGELQHHRQVVGQLAGARNTGRPFRRSAAGRSSPGHGRASRHAHARTGAARWRGRGRSLDVAAFGLQRVAAPPAGISASSSASARRTASFVVRSASLQAGRVTLRSCASG